MKHPFFAALLSALTFTAYGAKVEYESPNVIPPVESPARRLNWDLDKAYSEKSGERLRISLNTYWHFLPCDSKDKAIPSEDAGWGYFIVPGYWRSSGLGEAMRSADGRAIRKFNGRLVTDYPAAWYKRTFHPPESMKGKKVQLYFELCYSNPEVYINGKKVPVPFSFTPRYQVPVESYLKYGETNTIHVRAEILGSKYVKRGGIRGNLWLEARPEQNFGEPVLKTSLRKRKITVDFLRSGLNAGCGTLSGVIRDAADGKTVHTFSMPFASRVEIPYVTPKLWSPESPALYYLDLSVKDSKGSVLDAKSIRFGFREFRVEGGTYLLNDKPIALHTDTSWPSFWTPEWNLEPDFVRKAFRTLKRMNLNSLYGKFIMLSDAFFDLADEEGILIIYALDCIASSIHRVPIDRYINEFRKIAEENRTARCFINHPCNIGILLDVWYNYHKGTTHPAYTGMRADTASHLEPDADGTFRPIAGGDPNLRLEQPAKRKKEMDQLTAICREYFPSQEPFTGADGHNGNIYGTHIYHTWKAPLAELSALFSRYALTRDIPIFAGEMNIPFAAAFSDIRSYPNKQPLFKENAARLLGNQAYDLKGIYTTYAYSSFENDFLAGARNREALDNRTYYFLGDLYGLPLREYVEQTLFPWRYDGMNGIGFFEYVMTSRMVLAARSYPTVNFQKGDLTRPGSKVEFQQGTHHRPVFEVLGERLDLRPNLVTIPFLRGTAKSGMNFAGAGKDRYEIDHAYFEGETLRKQIAVINQTDEALDGNAEIRLLDERRACVASAKVNVHVPPFTNRSFPFEIRVPAVPCRGEFSLRAVLVCNGKKQQKFNCSMNVEVFPLVNTAANRQRKVWLQGCSNDFAEAIRNLGFQTENVTNPSAVPSGSVLIFGAHALEKAVNRQLFETLFARGVKILCMEQTSAASSELMKTRSRKAFSNSAGHPVLYGFKDADFANWRGSKASIPGYEKPHANTQWQDWGARNMVAAHVFRRPAHGNFIPLLVSGFDLFQSPLLEYRTGKNVWIANQLEISSRLGIDPVATHLFNRLLIYLDSWKPTEQKTAFYGGREGKKLLDKMQIRFTELNPGKTIDWNSFSTLIISDPDWKTLRQYAFEIADFVYAGGHVLYLHTGKEFSATWLPFVIDLGECRNKRQAHVSGTPDAVWRHGWDRGDLYWHNARTLPTFRNVPEIADATDPAVLVRYPYGTGNFVLVSIHPDRFGNTPACGKTARLLSALATSLGIEVGNQSVSPFQANKSFRLDLTNRHWKFAKDPQDIGLRERWFEGKGNPPWKTGQMTVAGEYIHTGITWKKFLEEDYRGIGWYSIDFELTAEEAALNDISISCYDVWSEDTMWINGRGIGSYGKAGADRGYRIHPKFLKAGKNTLVIRLKDTSGRGGLCGASMIRSDGSKRRFWKTPWPQGSVRDYEYPADMLRMY